MKRVVSATLFLAVASFAQQVSLTVRAVGGDHYVSSSTHYYTTPATPDKTNCTGTATTTGNTTDVDADCTTTSGAPAQTTAATVSVGIVHAVVESGSTRYWLSCSAHWLGSNCMRPENGVAYKAEVKGRTMWLYFPNGKKDLRTKFDIDVTGPVLPAEDRYLSSAALPAKEIAPPAQTQGVTTSESAKVHITSTPSGGEIYIDGKFFGNTPSDITLNPGEHAVKVRLGGNEWSRSVQITAGEISLHAEIPAAN